MARLSDQPSISDPDDFSLVLVVHQMTAEKENLVTQIV